MYDTFISYNSSDEDYAATVHEFIKANGLKPFCAAVSLLEDSRTDFGAAIDEALAEAQNLVVVASSATNIKVGYVQAEWRVFVDEKRAGRKPGNIITLLFGTIAINQLPLALRQYQLLEWTDQSKQDLLRFLLSPKDKRGKSRRSSVTRKRVSQERTVDIASKEVTIKVSGSKYTIEREPDIIYIEDPPKTQIIKYLKSDSKKQKSKSKRNKR